MPTSSPDWSTLASEYERLADSSALQLSSGSALTATAAANAAPSAAAAAAAAPAADARSAPR
jgi:hypothetical protein